MSDKEKFILQEIDTKEFYKGKAYQHQGGIYPCLTRCIDEAKIYNTQRTAYQGENSLNKKCGYSTFEVVPLDYINRPKKVVDTGVKEGNFPKIKELKLNEESSLVEKIEYVNELGGKDPTLNFLINLENGGLGHLTITEALDALATSASIDLPNRKRSLIIEVEK